MLDVGAERVREVAHLNGAQMLGYRHRVLGRVHMRVVQVGERQLADALLMLTATVQDELSHWSSATSRSRSAPCSADSGSQACHQVRRGRTRGARRWSWLQVPLS